MPPVECPGGSTVPSGQSCPVQPPVSDVSDHPCRLRPESQIVRLARVARAVQRPAAARAARRLGRVDLRQKIPDPGVREGGVTEQLATLGAASG